jgi:hypothetical protein
LQIKYNSKKKEAIKKFEQEEQKNQKQKWQREIDESVLKEYNERVEMQKKGEAKRKELLSMVEDKVQRQAQRVWL